ncbi:MAG: hypothetical protein Q8P23_01250, partial [bacterium]|nr:hypothetical protein [bacterium]
EPIKNSRNDGLRRGIAKINRQFSSSARRSVIDTIFIKDIVKDTLWISMSFNKTKPAINFAG